MKIKFLRQWHQFTIGAVAETLGEGVCKELIRRGFAEQVKEPVCVDCGCDQTKAVTKPAKNKQLVGARNK